MNSFTRVSILIAIGMFSSLDASYAGSPKDWRDREKYAQSKSIQDPRSINGQLIAEIYSHSSVMTEEYYEFKLINRTSLRIVYEVNDEQYYLNPGQFRNHKVRKRYGTNSGNVREYNAPVISYERYPFEPGRSRSSAQLVYPMAFFAETVGGKIFLSSRELQSSGSTSGSRINTPPMPSVPMGTACRLPAQAFTCFLDYSKLPLGTRCSCPSSPNGRFTGTGGYANSYGNGYIE